MVRERAVVFAKLSIISVKQLKVMLKTYSRLITVTEISAMSRHTMCPCLRDITGATVNNSDRKMNSDF